MAGFRKSNDATGVPRGAQRADQHAGQRLGTNYACDFSAESLTTLECAGCALAQYAATKICTGRPARTSTSSARPAESSQWSISGKSSPGSPDSEPTTRRKTKVTVIRKKYRQNWPSVSSKLR